MNKNLHDHRNSGRGDRDAQANAKQQQNNTTSVRNFQPSTSVKRLPHLTREIGLVLLVLASHTISSVVGMDSMLSTELMADAFTYAGRPYAGNEDVFSNFYYSQSGSKLMQCADLSERVTSSSASSDTNCDDDEDEDLNEFFTHISTLKSNTTNSCSAAFARNEDVWDSVLSFLNTETVLRLRGISKTVFKQSMSYASVLRMPHTSKPAIFIPCREDLLADEAAMEAALQPNCGQWQCEHCGKFTKTLVCATCPTGDLHRLFFGQLRRSATVPMVRWLVEDVLGAPPGSLVAVENHVDPHTRRGKGCAWVTVRGNDVATRLLAAHHRLFFDSVEEVEGVWLAFPSQESVLAAEADGRQRSTSMKHMPRKTIVVERASSAPTATHKTSTTAGTATAITPTVDATPRSECCKQSSPSLSTTVSTPRSANGNTPSGNSELGYSDSGYNHHHYVEQQQPYYYWDSASTTNDYNYGYDYGYDYSYDYNNHYEMCGQWGEENLSVEEQEWLASYDPNYVYSAAAATNAFGSEDCSTKKLTGVVHYASGCWRHDPYV